MTKLTATYLEQATIANFVKAYEGVQEKAKNEEIKTLCAMSIARIEKTPTTHKTATDILNALRTASAKGVAFMSDIINKNVKAIEKVDNIMNNQIDIHTALLIHNASTRDNLTINAAELKLSISQDLRQSSSSKKEFSSVVLGAKFKRAIYGASTAHAQTPTSIQALVSLGVATVDKDNNVTLLNKTKAQQTRLAELQALSSAKIASSLKVVK